MHSDKPSYISIKATTAVRILTLNRSFFENFGLESNITKNFVINGLEEAIFIAKEDVQKLE